MLLQKEQERKWYPILGKLVEIAYSRGYVVTLWYDFSSAIFNIMKSSGTEESYGVTISFYQKELDYAHEEAIYQQFTFKLSELAAKVQGVVPRD